MADPLEGVSCAGMIVTGASRARVATEYEPTLDAACDGMADLDPGASLYLYGSVATGTAAPPGSDIDLLTIDLDPQLAVELARSLSSDFEAVCRGAELAVSASGDFVGGHDEAYGNRVFLRHYCVHLTGPPQHVGLPDFAADARAARGFNGDIAQHARRWRTDLTARHDPAVVGRRAARKTLLAMAGLVSITDGAWTTDRQRAAQRWSQLHPAWAGEVTLLTDWSGGASTPTATDVERLLDGVIATVVDQFGELIGLWCDT